jgi:restriction endonuclease S subunit
VTGFVTPPGDKSIFGMYMTTTISNIAEVQIGYQPKGSVQPNPNGTHRLIQVKDIRDDRTLNAIDIYRIMPERDPDRYLVTRGDVLFLARGWRNYAVAIRDELQNTLAAGTFYIARIKTVNLLPEYLAWYINQPRTQAILKPRTQATNIPLVTKSVFETLEIDIPPLSVQRAIVELDYLAKKEQALLARLVNKRRQLVFAICMNAIKRTKE